MEKELTEKILEKNKAIALDMISFMDISSDEEEHTRKETLRRIRDYQQAMEKLNGGKSCKRVSIADNKVNGGVNNTYHTKSPVATAVSGSGSGGSSSSSSEPLFNGKDVASLPRNEIDDIWRPKTDDTITAVSKCPTPSWRPRLENFSSNRTSADANFSKEISRALYGDTAGHPPQGTPAYFEAAQNYATYGDDFTDFPKDLSALCSKPKPKSTPLCMREPPGFERQTGKLSVGEVGGVNLASNFAGTNAQPPAPHSNPTLFNSPRPPPSMAAAALAPATFGNPTGVSHGTPSANYSTFNSQNNPSCAGGIAVSAGGIGGIGGGAGVSGGCGTNKYAFLAPSVPPQYLYQPSNQAYLTFTNAPGFVFGNQNPAGAVDLRLVYAQLLLQQQQQQQQQQFRGPHSRSRAFVGAQAQAQAHAQAQAQAHVQAQVQAQAHIQKQVQAQAQVQAQVQHLHQQQQQQQHQLAQAYSQPQVVSSGPYSRAFGSRHYVKERNTLTVSSSLAQTPNTNGVTAPNITSPSSSGSSASSGGNSSGPADMSLESKVDSTLD